MTSWMLRGLVFAAGMVVVRLVQGTLINTYETQASLISLVLVVLYGLAALIWGFIDGRADAKVNWDPDRRRDLAMTWLLAGLTAGIVSGAVTWLISLLYPNVYVEGLMSEITTFAAFTALMVFVPAITTVSIGRLSIDRKRPEQVRRRSSDGEETDVFDSVREEEQTGPIPALGDGTAAAHHTSPVATVEREEDTTRIPPHDEKR